MDLDLSDIEGVTKVGNVVSINFKHKTISKKVPEIKPIFEIIKPPKNLKNDLGQLQENLSFRQDDTASATKPVRYRQTITRCPHVNSKHYARGMCNHCYHMYGRSKLATKCEHAYRLIYAKGMCQNCYLNSYQNKRRQNHK